MASEVNLIAVCGQVNQFEQVLRCGAWTEASIEQRLRPIVDDLGRVEIVERAQAVAFRTCAERRVETEASRFKPGHIESTVRTCHG